MYHDVPTINHAVHIDVSARENISNMEDNQLLNQSLNMDGKDDIMLESPQNQQKTVDTNEEQQEKHTERQLLVEKSEKKENVDKDVQMTDLDQAPHLPSSTATSDTAANAENIKQGGASGSKIVIDLSMGDDDDNDNDEDRKEADTSDDRGNPVKEEKENSTNQQCEEMSSSLKRKRSTESIEENDKEDESESEDKRATLRYLSLFIYLCYASIIYSLEKKTYILERPNDKRRKLRMKKLHGVRCSMKKINFHGPYKIFLIH